MEGTKKKIYLLTRLENLFDVGARWCCASMDAAVRTAGEDMEGTLPQSWPAARSEQDIRTMAQRLRRDRTAPGYASHSYVVEEVDFIG